MTCTSKRTGLSTQRTTCTTTFVEQAVVGWLRAAHGARAQAGGARWRRLRASPARPAHRGARASAGSTLPSAASSLR
jgi:hypothetical protein